MERMTIAIAGPYSAPTDLQRKENLLRLNTAAAQILRLGHIPLIGVNAALPVIEQSAIDDPYTAIMDISMAVISHCNALLLIAESPGANREKDFIAAKGLPIYYSIDEIPAIP